MNTLSQAFGFETVYNAVTTTYSPTKDGEEAATGRVEKFSNQNIVRVPLHELELTYMRDATVYNSINKTVQTIMSAGHALNAKDKKSLEFFKNFIDRMGNHGGPTWEQYLSQTFHNTALFGKSWTEFIKNKSRSRIIDLDLIDTKTMDYAKNDKQRIVLDKNNNPIGYTQTLPMEIYNFDFDSNKKKAPKYVYLQPNQIFVKKDDVAQIKLNRLGDGFYPLGLVEPIYTNSVRKQNTEEALANFIWRHGFPIIWAKLGDLQHEPTPQQIQNMLEKLKDLTYKKEISTPYYYDLQMLESGTGTDMQNHLTYFQDQQVTGMGIPKPYALGLGDSVNRATLESMSHLWELTLIDIIKKVTSDIRKQVFLPIAKREGLKEVPTIDWDLVGIGAIDRKAKRLVSYYKTGIIQSQEDVDKITEYIRKSEDLD